MSYTKFFAMIITSTLVMFVLMYSTIYALDHVWWSDTKAFMALYMGAAMAIIMLAFMRKMYDSRKVNTAIFAGSTVLFALGLWLVQSQTTIDDTDWMKAMIPHHSIAVMTSERANLSDPRVRQLADDIILAQRREIAEMEALIADLERGDYSYQEPIAPSVPPVKGGNEEVDGAPSLTVAAQPLRGEVLILEEVKVDSDAWLVVHPAASSGGPDATQVLGYAFVLHGTTPRVPVAFEGAAAEPGTVLYVMLHNDTGEIGQFEFGREATLDPPLMREGQPVMQSVVVQ